MQSTGNTRIMHIIQKIKNGNATQSDLDTIVSTGELMELTSSCGLGKTAAVPILFMLTNFKDEIDLLINK